MDERLKHGNPEIIQPQNVDVFLLCGGKGTRLKVSEEDQLRRLPKPLVSIDTPRGSIRMIDNAILGLTESGFGQLTILVGRDPETQGSEIEDYVVSTHGGLNPSFSREDTPLGTAGAAYVAFVFSRRDNAIITPIDTLFPFDRLCIAIEAFSKNDTSIMWIVTSNPGENAQNSGKVIVNSEYIIRNDEGKPDMTPIREGELATTSTGIIVVSKIFVFILPPSLSELKIRLLKRGEKISFFDVGVPTPDLGTPDRLRRFGRKN